MPNLISAIKNRLSGGIVKNKITTPNISTLVGKHNSNKIIRNNLSNGLTTVGKIPNQTFKTLKDARRQSKLGIPRPLKGSGISKIKPVNKIVN